MVEKQEGFENLVHRGFKHSLKISAQKLKNLPIHKKPLSLELFLNVGSKGGKMIWGLMVLALSGKVANFC